MTSISEPGIPTESRISYDPRISYRSDTYAYRAAHVSKLI